MSFVIGLIYTSYLSLTISIIQCRLNFLLPTQRLGLEAQSPHHIALLAHTLYLSSVGSRSSLSLIQYILIYYFASLVFIKQEDSLQSIKREYFK